MMGTKMRVPFSGGRSADGSHRPGLPETHNNYVFNNARDPLGHDTPPHNNEVFRVDVLRGQCMPDQPAQSKANHAPRGNKKLRPNVRAKRMGG